MSRDTPQGPRVALGVVGRPATGVSYLRFEQPFEHLAGRGWTLRTLGESLDLERRAGAWHPSRALLDGVSLVVFPQLVHSPTLADGTRVELCDSLCDEARRRGIPIVHSIDDWLPAIEPANPDYELVRGSRHNLDRLLDDADAFVVTTRRLERTLAPRGRPVEVLPNAVDPARWRTRPRTSTTPRVGWAGSSSHLDDLLAVIPALRTLRRRVEFELVIFGLVDRPLDEQLAEIRRLRSGLTPAAQATAERFTAVARELRGLRATHVPFRGMDRFFETLPALDLDVGLCPLLDTEFNRHKSAVKAYEYAAVGTTALASRVTPYREEPFALVDNDPAAWVEALEALLRDSDLRAREHTRQLEFVLAERTIERLAPRWADTLNRYAVPETAAARTP